MTIQCFQERKALTILKTGAFSLIAGIALSVGSTSALAGSGEVKALDAALLAENPSTTASQANSQQLLDAVRAVISQPKYSTAKAKAVVVGEALKEAGKFAPDAGEFFAAAIVAANGDAADALGTILADKANFIPLAAKTAGSGKGINVLQIPGLAAGVFTNEQDSTFTTAAGNAKNKPGAGAILGGRARQYVDAMDPLALSKSVTLADTALANKALQAGAQDIARYISAELDDTTTFAVNLANGSGNTTAKSKYTVSIAIGTAFGDPTNAGNVAHALLNQNQLQPDGTESKTAPAANAAVEAAAIKGIATIAKSMGAAADIEEIQKIGNAIGQEIRTGALKLAKAASLTKTLVTAVMNKPLTGPYSNSITQNSSINKRDEIAEVAAYMVGGLIGSTELNLLVGTKAKSAATKLLAIITSATKVKPNAKIGGPSPSDFAADVALSVAYTVLNAPAGSGAGQIAQDIKDAFATLLKDPKTAAKIDKTNTTLNGQLVALYNGTFDTDRLEDGLDPMGALSDPETDTHAFSI